MSLFIGNMESFLLNLNKSKRNQKHIHTKAEIENAKLIKTLNEKMFKGFTKTKQLVRISKLKEKPKINKATIKEIESYNPYPFESYYNVSYKDKYLKALKGPNLNDVFLIQNLTNCFKLNQHLNKDNSTSKKLFMTVDSMNQTNSNDINQFNNEKNNLEKNKENNEMIIKKIFNNNPQEMDKYSSLNFFAIDKNPVDIDDVEYMKKNKGKNKNRSNRNNYAETDFLYKISHKQLDESKDNDVDNKIIVNFQKNKGFKKGFVCLSTNKDKDNIDKNKNKKLNLKLDIQGSNAPKPISLKQKRINLIKKNLEYLQTFSGQMINNFKKEDFETELTDKNNNEIVNNIENSYMNNEIKENENEDLSLTNNNINQNTISNRGNNINLNKYYDTIYNQGSFKKLPYLKTEGSTTNYTNSFRNMNPKSMSKSIYNNNQLNYKKRFNFIHNLAFEERTSKPILSPIKCDLKMDQYISNDSHLLEKKVFNHKEIHEKECKIRDVIIGNKLKNNFSKKDIQRMLNGKPLVDNRVNQSK